MGLSTTVEWLNENEQRAYPLTSDSTDQILGISLFKCFLDANIVYTNEEMPIDVYLTQIDSDGTDIEVFLSGQAMPSFSIVAAAGASYPVYVRNSSGSLLVVGEEIKKFLPYTSTLVEGTKFEPSVVSEIRGRLGGVASLGINGNMLSGPITFEEGVQVSVNFPDTHTWFMAVGNSEGIPLDCSDFFSDELEYDCGNIVSWINGATAVENGGSLKLTAGQNVKIYEDRDNRKIYIGLDFTEGDYCERPQLPPR
jgi:hypothetical protein